MATHRASLSGDKLKIAQLEEKMTELTVSLQRATAAQRRPHYNEELSNFIIKEYKQALTLAMKKLATIIETCEVETTTKNEIKMLLVQANLMLKATSEELELEQKWFRPGRESL